MADLDDISTVYLSAPGQLPRIDMLVRVSRRPGVWVIEGIPARPPEMPALPSDVLEIICAVHVLGSAPDG